VAPASRLVRRGWPKMAPCPLCEKPRLATSPGDSLHRQCRERVARLDDVAEAVLGPPLAMKSAESDD